MYSCTVEIARQQKSRSADLESWRNGSAKLQRARLLRRQSYRFDFSDLDRAADRLKDTLERDQDLPGRLGSMRDFTKTLWDALNQMDPEKKGNYSLRKRLFSLACRATNVLKEMETQSRAPEFNSQAIRRILKDYEDIRF